MEGYGHLLLAASSCSLASNQPGPERRVYKKYPRFFGTKQAEEITINWLSRIDTMLTRTVFGIHLWIFGEKNFSILPLFSATLPANVELFYK